MMCAFCGQVTELQHSSIPPDVNCVFHVYVPRILFSYVSKHAHFRLHAATRLPTSTLNPRTYAVHMLACPLYTHHLKSTHACTENAKKSAQQHCDREPLGYRTHCVVAENRHPSRAHGTAENSPSTWCVCAVVWCRSVRNKPVRTPGDIGGPQRWRTTRVL